MPGKRRRYDPEFKAKGVRIVNESQVPLAEVARELGVSRATLGRWVERDRQRHTTAPAHELTEPERAELLRLRWENTRLTVERDMLERSVILWMLRSMGEL
ncbi:transposase [Streptomyces sp. NPDC058307]|uniref:transposase n=1 Tax=Streptomyces sp. NPDC058307 TaxID=3346439 RepID=UPI0036E9016D